MEIYSEKTLQTESPARVDNVDYQRYQLPVIVTGAVAGERWAKKCGRC